MAGALGMMANGGRLDLRRLADEGRFGDTMLAHITPEEGRLLEELGGAGTINPETGLPEYFSFKKFLTSVLPVAAAFIPGIGPAIGGALGLSGATAGIVGSALLGGGLGALTSGGDLKKSLMGAGLGGITAAAAPTISDWFSNAVSGAGEAGEAHSTSGGSATIP